MPDATVQIKFSAISQVIAEPMDLQLVRRDKPLIVNLPLFTCLLLPSEQEMSEQLDFETDLHLIEPQPHSSHLVNLSL